MGQHLLAAFDEARNVFGTIIRDGATKAVALLVMVRGFSVVLPVLECFAQREMEMDPIILLKVGAFELPVMRLLDLGLLELECLEIGEAPPRRSKRRSNRRRASVSADAFLLTADDPQQVAEMQPNVGIVGKAGGEIFIIETASSNQLKRPNTSALRLR